MLPEMRALLEAWKPGEPAAEFAKRVQRDDLVGKATARTAKDYVYAFTRRFLTPTDTPARHLRHLVNGGVSRQMVNDLIFHYTTEAEFLLGDFTVLRYWPAVREGRLAVANQDVRQFIWEAEQDGRIPTPWSADVHRDLPARVLRALHEFGLLGDLKSGRREIGPYRPADRSLVYLAYLLHFGGVPDGALAEQRAWAVFGLEPQDVWHRLDTLAGEGWFVVQRAGQVVRLTWHHRTMEDALDALAR
ncbi:MAG: DUF1819 family protein [Chloroflexi bacterium]|nr:DUF1819 family protein [Chloroflexota bacterium]